MIGRFSGGLAAAAVLALGFGCVGPAPVWGADHRDGPRVSQIFTTPLDINDIYMFRSPTNRNNTVMALTVGGAAVGVLGAPIFYPGGVYELRLSDDGDPLTDEAVIQFVFSDPNASLRQSFMVIDVNIRENRSTVLASGVTGRSALIRGGGQVQAGLFDDPFFFDLLAFTKFRTAVQQGLPLADRLAPFLPPNFPNNFFGNFNVLGIVLEVPTSRLLGPSRTPEITLWARTLLPTGEQFDRMGNPGINTVVGFPQPLEGFPDIQNLFNSLVPAMDVGLRSAAADRIHAAFGLPLDKANQLTGQLLPDVIHFDTRSANGFPNGRRLADDVIDTELGLLTGGALTSDRVVNDSVFRTAFPYLSPPLPRGPIGRAVAATEEP